MADIAQTEGADVMPMEGEHESGAPSTPGALSFLSADWVNTRIGNVAQKVDAILEKIIDRGLLSDGFAPFETPITDDMLMKMTPGQFQALYDTIPDLYEKANLLARMDILKKEGLPPRELLPGHHPTASPATPPKLAFGPSSNVPLGGTE